MKSCNRDFKNVYDNRIIHPEHLKIVADMYAVNIVDIVLQSLLKKKKI
jgi:hypothetical protein